MYYAVAKIAVAGLPFAQSEACLICANDQTINNFYSNSQLRMAQADWTSMLTALGKASNDFNNAFS
jgi:hypothetical protein